MREAFGVSVLWNHATGVFGVTRQNAAMADHVEPRRWNCRAEPQKVMVLERERMGAVFPDVLEGSRGIGRTCARLAAERGFAVALSYRSNAAAAADVVAHIEGTGGKAISVRCEVATEGDVQRLFDAAAERLGSVTGVVNNAGIVAPSLPLAELSVERMKRVFDVNVLGAYLVARQAARVLSRSRGGQGGSLVNVSSVASRLGSPNEYVDYAGSKAAVDTLTLGLAKELAADGVRVNAVRPGLIDTDIHESGGQPGRAQRLGRLTPLGRAGTADEAARAIVWLLSDEASYVTGTLLDVAGGR